MARRQPWVIGALLALAPAATLSAEPSPTTGPTASSSALPPAPPADSVERAPEQVVWLRSGAIVRGQLVDYQPGERIVLQLATGEIRTISWSEISRASFVSSPAVPASASAKPTSSPAPTTAASPSRGPGGVLIGIHPARPTLRLEAKSKLDVTAGWQTQCNAPCGKLIEVEDRTFRIAGPGLRPSNAFHFNADGKTAKLVVSEGTQRAHGWGVGLLISGVVLGLSSGALYGAGRLEDSDPAVIAGLIGLGLGAAAVIGSVPLLARGRTTVREGSGKHVAVGPVPWPTF